MLMHYAKMAFLWITTEGQLIATIVAGTLVKLALSENKGFWRSLVTAGVAIFSASVMTLPTIYILGLDPDHYLLSVAALWTLTGEGGARWLISMSRDESAIGKFITGLIRGGRDK